MGGVMTTAILTAGGTGSRMKNNIPKQFITVNEVPIIIYTLINFQKCDSISRIIIACLKEWQPILKAYIKEYRITKVIDVVEGGETGIDSIKNCFNAVTSTTADEIILIHDGNRPLVTEDIIKSNINDASKFGATSTYIDVHDGVVMVDDKLNITNSSIRREDIKSTQTPHTFKYNVLKDVFSRINNKNNFISLADAAAQFGYEVKLVKGSELNFKITTKNDLKIFESVMNKRPDYV
jgi:2-C-methyl-D-erythritol 4-phosphate cytidylyltransferase